MGGEEVMPSTIDLGATANEDPRGGGRLEFQPKVKSTKDQKTMYAPQKVAGGDYDKAFPPNGSKL